jgi:hypothetical protein
VINATWSYRLISVCCCILCCSTGFAQDEGGQWWIKSNPFGLFAGQFQSSYERAVSDKVTVQLTGGVVRSNLDLNTDDLESLLSINTSLNAVDWIGFLAMPEARVYLSPEVGKGFYLGAFARVRCIKRTMTTNFVGVQRRTAVGAGAVIGGQFKISEHVRGDLFLGPQIKSTTTTLNEHFVYAEEEFLPGIRFGMNFAWTP